MGSVKVKGMMDKSIILFVFGFSSDEDITKFTYRLVLKGLRLA
jgi:hypothetical protein